MRRGKGGCRGGGGGTKNGLLPSSLRIISSCLKTVSSNAGSVASTVRSAGASVAASIASPAEDERDQVLWAGFDKLELGSSRFKHVLLLGYSNGFQVLDVEDASNVRELVSKRDGPVTFLQMQPRPAQCGGTEGFSSSHPMLSVVAGDESNGSGIVQGGRLSALIQDGGNESSPGTCISTPTVVRFFSLRSNSYVHVLRFRSAVYVVRCSPRVVAVALAAQIYCFDAVTLENKFSVLTYPMPGAVGVNVGYGPVALGSRWLAYASNNPFLSNTGRLSPQNLTPSPGVSPSTSPGNGSLVARYAMESSKQLAAGIMNLGDMGYKTLSKYCQDFLPDGSNSPVLSNSGRKVGIVISPSHPSEADNAGMVVVKDFVSREVISQFRAHTSPISAICFDPSGTLLVTASVHGNNINVFRIMPTPIPNGSNSSRYDWASSHVHLYKLYRGLTTAVIQDISFSHYSQWISVVSSRGTCHIYVLSPFGGDACLQAQNCDPDGPVLVPSLSLPWWSTASWVVMDHQCITPPLPMTLSVVSRIKNGTSGWLNTVSNVAASAAGKIHVPSGAVAAVFHNSVAYNAKETRLKDNSLEHLLVYSPSGHVIQHELLPSSVPESSDSSGRIGSGTLMPAQDDELRVNAEPVQWWDVCRRKNWPDRDECMPSIVLDKPGGLIFDPSGYEENNPKNSSPSSLSEKNSVKMHGRSCWYLSNAEVGGISVRIPVWQKSKISFFMMSPSKDNWGSTVVCSGGEIEIEKIPTLEVELRQKDLLPVFQQSHGDNLGWPDRAISGEKHLMTSSHNLAGEHSGAFSEDRQGAGSLKMQGNADDLGEMNQSRPCRSIQPRGVPCHHDFIESSNLFGCAFGSIACEDVECSVSAAACAKSNTKMSKKFENDCCELSALSLSDFSCAVAPVDKTIISKNGVDDEISTILDAEDSLVKADTIASHDKHGHVPYVQEGYCKLSELDDCHESTEALTDADSSSSSHCEKVKHNEDGDNDDMLGGVFAFSEEG